MCRQEDSISICLHSRLGELQPYNWDLLATRNHKGNTKLIGNDVLVSQFHLFLLFCMSSQGQGGLPDLKLGFPGEKPNQRRQTWMSIFVNGTDAPGRKGGRSIFPGAVCKHCRVMDIFYYTLKAEGHCRISVTSSFLPQYNGTT